jgi:hypothetical protein
MYCRNNPEIVDWGLATIALLEYLDIQHFDYFIPIKF